jgi:condensation domain-containing protein/phthiocerol/phthiodiolone dimycocerosyl transferase-like enzyme
MARLRDGLLETSDTAEFAVKASDTIRPLGPLEHMFWLLDQNRSVHFAVTAQIAGKASLDGWQDALDRVQERHPILSVCIEGTPGSVPQFRREDAAPIPLRIVEGDPKIHWEGEVGEELATPFDPSRAPLIRAVLIQGSRDTAFILVAHHAIADGLSLAYAIRDTLSALSGELLESLPWAPAQEEILGVGARPAALTGAHAQPDGALGGRPSTYRPLDDARPVVQGLHLAPALTASLRDRARQEGTTVQGALCSALTIAGRQMSADWRDSAVRIFSPINIRPFLDVGESCGVFVSAATGSLDGQAIGFWELARNAKAAIAIGQARDGVLATLSAIGGVVGKGAGVAGAADFAANAFAHEAMLTNLGVLTFDSRFGALKLESVWGPAVLTGMERTQTIGVATVNGSICLTHTSYTPPEGLLQAMRSVLVDACR